MLGEQLCRSHVFIMQRFLIAFHTPTTGVRNASTYPQLLFTNRKKPSPAVRQECSLFVSTQKPSNPRQTRDRAVSIPLEQTISVFSKYPLHVTFSTYFSKWSYGCHRGPLCLFPPSVKCWLGSLCLASNMSADFCFKNRMEEAVRVHHRELALRGSFSC